MRRRAARLAEYNGRRDRLEAKERDLAGGRRSPRGAGPRPTSPTRPGSGRTASWRRRTPTSGPGASQNGLKPEAMAHFTTAVHLDPSRDSSWRHLGYVKRNGRWISPDQAADDAKDDREQRQANRHWEPLLRKWKGWLGGLVGGPSRGGRGTPGGVTDPRAVPSILKVFPTGGPEADQYRLLRMLERIDDPRSSRGLAELAVSAGSPSVRTAAIAVLGGGPCGDYAGPLVESIRGKIGYEIKPLEGPGSTGALVFETSRVRLIRTYDAPPVFLPAASFRGYAGVDANGLPVIAQGRELDRMSRDPNPYSVAMKVHELEARTAGLIALANVKADVVQQRMAADIGQVEMINRQAEEDNARVIPVLQQAADAPADLKDDEEAWHVWWYDTLGYSYQVGVQGDVHRGRLAVAVPAAPDHDLLRRGDAGPHARRPPADRVDPGRRPGPRPGRGHRRAGLPARRLRPPQPARPDPAGLARQRRFGGLQRLSPVLAGQPRLGHGPRAEAGRRPPHASAAWSGSPRVEPDTHSAPLQPRRRRDPHLLRRHRAPAGPRQHAPRPPPPAVRRPPHRGGRPAE